MFWIRRLCALAILCSTGSSLLAAECTVVRKDSAVQRELLLNSTNSNCLLLEQSEVLDSVAVTMLSDKPAPYAIRVLQRKGERLETVSTHTANPQGMLASHLFPGGRKLALAPALSASEGQRKVLRLQYTVREKVGFVVIRIDEP